MWPSPSTLLDLFAAAVLWLVQPSDLAGQLIVAKALLIVCEPLWPFCLPHDQVSQISRVSCQSRRTFESKNTSHSLPDPRVNTGCTERKMAPMAMLQILHELCSLLVAHCPVLSSCLQSHRQLQQHHASSASHIRSPGSSNASGPIL